MMPTNIHVDSYEPTNGRAAAGWELGDARYHFWFDTKTLKIERGTLQNSPTIYKNPLTGSAKDPGYFDTRRLDATKPINARIVQMVFDEIKANDLIEKAKKEFEAREAKRLADSREYMRLERAKQAGPELLAALERVRDAYGFDESIDSSIWREVNAAIAKARGE